MKTEIIKDRIKKKWVKEKKNKSADETLKIVEEILDYNKGAQKTFAHASKVDKGKSEPKSEESIAKRVRLGREKITEIEEEEKITTMNCLNNTLLIIKVQVICTKSYARQMVQEMRIDYIWSKKC